jgi:hypothetical protein
LQPTALLVGESETSRITGTSGGHVEITNSLNAPNAINVGNLGAVITSTQNLGSTTIRRGHTSQTNSGIGSSINRYFDIQPTNNNALNATLRIKYFDAELNAINEPTLVFFKTPNKVNWYNMGFTTRDASLNFVEKIALADFSKWTLSNNGNVLPIIVNYFGAICLNNNVVLNWKTALEQNSKNFIVQASNDGIAWQNITTILASTNSTTEKQYNYTIQNNTHKLFRLVLVDRDDKFTYSAIVQKPCTAIENDFASIYPNPVQDKFIASFTASLSSSLQIKIIDEKGAIVKMQNTTVQKGSNVLPVNIGYLPKANYIIQLIWNSGQLQKTIKLIKQ